ncbi:MAG TPA: peroxiredoxin, partial [Saprospiraceae bacterium]|nr:peroxiredoxin [Saprospiraceae bacterium]
MAIEDYKPKFKLKKGDSAPNFMAINQNGDKIELKKIKSKWTILFFYPQDSTPTCTKEACNLRDHYEDLKSLDCSIFGISQDSESSHQKFISKNKLPY